MDGKSIFAEEWRECLQAQFMHVVRNNDIITLRTLVEVMHSVGFSDAELNQMRVMATMHVDDVGEDFVPDLEILAQEAPPPPPEPVVQQVEAVEEVPPEEEEVLPPPKKADPPGFTQMSLF